MKKSVVITSLLLYLLENMNELCCSKTQFIARLPFLLMHTVLMLR